MSKRTDLFPGWFFGPGGASRLCETEADVPKGWTENQAEALAADAKAGSKPATEKPKAEETAKPATKPAAAAPASANPLGEARKAYKAVTGKGASPKWDAATINDKIAEFKASSQQLDL